MSQSISSTHIFERKPPKVYLPWQKHDYTFFVFHGRGDNPNNFAPRLLLSDTNHGTKMMNNASSNVQNEAKQATSSATLEPLEPQAYIPQHPQSSPPNEERQHVYESRFGSVLRNTKLIFLHAGVTEVIDSRWHMPGAWFRISSLKDPNKNSDEQVAGLCEHVKQIQELIDAEIQAGVSAEKIALIGLSQGCAQALFASLTLDLSGARLGAVVGMSGWLPFSDLIKDSLDTVCGQSATERPAPHTAAIETLNKLRSRAGFDVFKPDSLLFRTPIFIGHGTADEKVSPALGELARDTLHRLGFSVSWHPYIDFGHWWKTPEEIDDMLSFLQTHIGLEVIHAPIPSR